ncbi:ArnT family glycosyltransferase [Daejeonella oryzae]|uniref:ArnT family glycosyltransferase n=1 Tax=Daejeonella oryzae TaxID=1122943 RepID=UPI00041B0C86|nr:glycosyltransferase family 39 protein [Daejeonella oryzae]
MDQKLKNSSNLFVIFLFGWTLINAVQAGFMELHPDEAYYWIYSRFPDWGYFDHPPMVAFFIKAGDALFQSKFGLRLLTIISNTLSVYLLWQILRKYSTDVKLFIILFSSILIFHIYGFITTPDSPLFFFSILFFYVYQRYAAEDKITLAIWLSLIIAAMFYSKYHGVLLVFFTILSNLKLFKRPSFYLIILLVVILFAPHIYWQIQNGYPSIYYHLIDRSAKPYKFEYTSDYLLGQLLIAGPLVGWYLYKSAVSVSNKDIFIRAIKFNFYGIFLFFLLSTFKGRVEPHWTLIAFPPLFILSFIYISQKTEILNWFYKLAFVNIAVILIMRLVVIIPLPGIQNFKQVAYYYGAENWAKQIKSLAADKPVVILGGFQEASQYNFYNRTLSGFAYDSRYYRKNQFDIWPLEDSLRNKKVYYVNSESHGVKVIQDTILTSKGDFYGRWIDDVRLFQKVDISTQLPGNFWKASSFRKLKLKIYNPYNQSISFSNKNQKWDCFLEFGFMEKGKINEFKPVISNFDKLIIASKESAEISAVIRSPVKSGEYKLIFSIRTDPFPGSRNSRMIPVTIN